MKLTKRDCGINMRLVPYGAGWTDVYLDIGNDSHYFIISNVMGNQFNALISILYYMYPDVFVHLEEAPLEYLFEVKDPDNSEKTIFVDSLAGIFDNYTEIPWKGTFEWDEEGEYSKWTIEREKNRNKDFYIKISIDHKDKQYEYSVKYKDFCYAVAKASTEALKECGFVGYQKTTYTQDLNLRELIYLKAIALDCMDAVSSFYVDDKYKCCSDFNKEIELLLFEM